MPTVFETLQLPTGAPATGTVIFYLVGDQGPITSAIDTAGATVVRQIKVPLDATGSYSVSLTSNDNILPANTVWARSYNGGRIIDTLDVGTAGPYDATDIRADPPGSLTPTELAAHAADTTLHGGGRSLGVALISEDFTITGAGPTDIPGAQLSFTAPEPAVRRRVRRPGPRRHVGRCRAGVAAGVDRSRDTGDAGRRCAPRPGGERAGHPPVFALRPRAAGRLAQQPGLAQARRRRHGQLQAAACPRGGTGNMSLTVDNALLGKSLSYLRAYTV